MIRIFALALLAAMVWFLLARLFRMLKAANIDWTGVTAAIAFIVLAFWLRHITGMG